MKNKNYKKTNMTTLVVRDAMKSVAKDVRKPKAVRVGIVKPLIRETNKIDFIILNRELTFKEKHLLNTPNFNNITKYITISPMESWMAPQNIVAGHQIEPVEIIFVPKNKKLQKLKELFENKKTISLIAVYKNGLQITAYGFISEIKSNSLTEEYSFIFLPDYFTVN